jgi:PAP2 superfamily
MNTLALMLLAAGSATAPAQDKNLIPEVRVEPQRARPDVVIKWNDIALRVIRADRSPPPVAARNLAITHLAIYDAVMAIERTHLPYAVDVAPPLGASPEAAAVTAAHKALVALYPKHRAFLDEVVVQCLGELPIGAATDAGAELGRFVADRMVATRCDDGSDREGNYTPKNQPGFWQPTAPQFRNALLPEWGCVRAFAIKKGTQYQPPAPPALTSDAYAAAYHEVKRLGGKHSKHRTEAQTQIAHFWADDVGTVTPPGHWNQIAQTIAQDRRNTLAENARLFAHLNISLADAGILCWVIKFTFEFWRPVTAIQQADRDWMPLLNTPPFPAYVSGHSTFSSAAATVLANSFGTDSIRFATTSDGLPGMTRVFDTISSAAQEAGMSRIYGGIHWQFDNVEGLKVGRQLGEYVYRNTLQPRPRITERRALYPPLPIIVDR